MRPPADPLAALDPDAIADTARECVRAHARRLGTSADGSAIAAQVHELVRYARGSGDAASAGAALAHAVPALYGCAATCATGAPGPDYLARLPGGADAEPLDVAMHAAWARWRIACGETVPLSALVMLGGMSPRSGAATRMVRDGEVRAERVAGDWVVGAADARVWLATRTGRKGRAGRTRG